MAEHYLQAARSHAQGVTVKQAVDALIAGMRTEGLAASTITTAEFRLEHFFHVARNGERSIRWLNHRGAELYAAAQVERSADTHQAELALAKQVGDLCVKRRWLKSNPFAGVEPVGRKTRGSSKPRFRVDESRAIMAHCLEHGDSQHAVITLAYLLLGARASELVKRSVRDLDDNGSLLWIERTKTEAGERKLTIPDVLRGLLAALVEGKAPDAPIFTKDDGTRATRFWARHHVLRITKEACGRALSPQALRRTQSDLATDAGVAAVEIARHLGQTSTRVTDRSYRDRNVVAGAKTERAFQMLAGGKR